VISILAIALNLCPILLAESMAPTRLIWTDPKPLTVADWTWGPGGPARAPQPPFRFIRENLGGTNPKIDVADGQGALWTVKFGGEVHAETFMSRFLYALGYHAEPVYYVPEGVILGANGLKRSKPFLSRAGKFRRARFKRCDENGMVYADEIEWAWNANPFLGSRELNGLKIVMMLASNWDGKDARDRGGSNTAVFVQPSSRPKAYIYSFTDWGSTLGTWGGFFQRGRWDPAGYERQTKHFVQGLRNGTIVWGYTGKHKRDIVDGITTEDVLWLTPYLHRITDEDLRTGLVASGANAADAERFSRSIRNRIAQLDSIARSDGMMAGARR
jgi:hypothetical protein